MCQLNCFGPRGGARREEHYRDVVGIGELGGRLGSSGGGDELVGGDHLLARTDDDVAVLGVGNHQRGRQTVDQLP